MKIPILMYHRVGDNSAERRFTVSTALFEQQMRCVRDLSYHVVGLDEVTAAVEGKTVLAAKSVAITFDDGFQDTFENAAPVLSGLGYSATFFLVSQLLGTRNTWMEREGYPSAHLMNWTAAKELLKHGFTVGSHSRTHPSLIQHDETRISDEVEGSRRDLEDRLAAPIRYFAYPYGHFDGRVLTALHRSGYAAACSTQSGFNNVTTDRYRLRRLDVSGRDSTRTFIRSLEFGENSMTARRLFHYYSKQAASRILFRGI